MRAMVMRAVGAPLVLEERPDPLPGPGELCIRVEACGVCRTDLHILDGELAAPRLPLVLGHEIVGRVEALGPGVEGPAPGARVGVPWLAGTCGRCEACRRGAENLCEAAEFTGFSRDGGYAEACLARAAYVLPLPATGDAAALAPLLCAGLIGYRTLAAAGPAERLGIWGFGAAAHLVAQVAVWQGREVYAFTRPGDRAAQEHALSLGAVWAGGSDERPPRPLDAALIFAPVGALIPAALATLRPGGTVVAGGIHMTDIPAFPYALLWQERSVRSVANLTRADGAAFLALAEAAGVAARVTRYPLAEANRALADLRAGALQGAAVLLP